MEEALGCHHLLEHEKCNDDVGGLVPPVDSMTGLEAFLAKECGDRGAKNLLNARNTWVERLAFCTTF